MVNDQHMTETLSDMLRPGETLRHPIFGTVKQGGFQTFAYFGFTESHFLIAYLTTGNAVTDIARIPLDIKSVKIKKTKIFSEYKIHILFENKKTFEISAFPKVLKIKSQKENLPLFLEHLKSKSKKQAKPLEETEGKKIRWQYFNTYIYMMLSTYPAISAMIIMGELRRGNFDIWNVIVEMSGATPVMLAIYGILIGPCIILSIFNRFAFGKLLGVVNEDTLFLENREIPITDIRRSFIIRVLCQNEVFLFHMLRFLYVPKPIIWNLLTLCIFRCTV